MDNATMNSSGIANETMYCNLAQFHTGYREVHGYLSLLVCLLGSVANVLNISVLTTKEMRCPTNFILTGLALADLMVMMEYIPYAIHKGYFDPLYGKTASYFTYSAAVFMLFHALFSQICHFISCCLTLILAIWRYIAITYLHNNAVWCSAERTMWAIGLTYVLCPIMCFPIYLSLTITSTGRNVYENGTFLPQVVNVTMVMESTTVYNRTIYYVNYKSEAKYKKMSFWVYSVVLKLIPCLLLTIFSLQLIKALLAAKKRRYNLLNNKGIPLEKINGKANSGSNQRFVEKEQQTDRTTKMLLAVLLLFLITEFPQAILGLVSGLNDGFDKYCHRPLGDLLDIFALTNSAINFILYCSMSTQFRTTFRKLFRKWYFPKRGKTKHEVTAVAATVTNV